MIASEQNAASSQRKSSAPLLDQSGFSVERMPMLGVVFDRFAAALVDGLRPMCRTPTMFSIDNIATGGLFEILASSKGCICAVLNSAELDCRSLAIFDQKFVVSLVQILLGGDANDSMEQLSRPFTKIELGLVQRISDLTAKSLQTAFAGIIEASFTMERQEALSDTTILGRRDFSVVTANIHFQALGMSGKMTVLIPQTAFQPIRQKLARDVTSETATGDPRWTRQLQTGVSFAEMTVKGILEEIPMTLGEVAEMKVGHVLNLEGLGMGRVRLECGEHNLFWCKLNQVEGRYTLEIEEPIIEHRDILDDFVLN